MESTHIASDILRLFDLALQLGQSLVAVGIHYSQLSDEDECWHKQEAKEKLFRAKFTFARLVRQTKEEEDCSL